MFPICFIDSGHAKALEPLGTKRKFWFNDGDCRKLFKSDDRGTGEDWAEKIACELCELLGLPHVVYNLAQETDGRRRPGVVCESCADEQFSLVLGNQLLLERHPNYPGQGGHKYAVREHTIDAVSEVLATLEPPPDKWVQKVPAGIETALDVFAGYVMLDAWIANQDRHHENWAALRDGNTLRLAPTFDHGASMARNISDKEREERLGSRDRNRQIPQFVRRATSAFYSDTASAKPMSTVEAWKAFTRKAPTAVEVWRKQLGQVDRTQVKQLMAEVPLDRMSHICQDFTLQLLMENQRRLMTGDSQ